MQLKFFQKSDPPIGCATRTPTSVVQLRVWLETDPPIARATATPPSAVLLDSMLRQAEEDAKIRVVHSPQLSREELTVI